MYYEIYTKISSRRKLPLHVQKTTIQSYLPKNIFACLFSIHNAISLSRHEQVCLSGLHFERYFSHHCISGNIAHLNILVHDVINLLYKVTCLFISNSCLISNARLRIDMRGVKRNTINIINEEHYCYKKGGRDGGSHYEISISIYFCLNAYQEI